MIALALLLLAAQERSSDVVVTAPGKPNIQTPATLVIEPAAMFVVACDADGDGATTRNELDACVRRTFAAIDTAGKGTLGYIGYADWQTRWLGDQGALPSPLEVDRNGDDRISEDELVAQFGKLFARFDRNADRQVTRAEALTVRAVAADAKSPVGEPQRGAKGGGKGRRAHPPGERVPLPPEDTKDAPSQ